MTDSTRKTLVCSHCLGWGINHIPVKNNFEQCKVCHGEGVSVEQNGRVLFWGGKQIIDKKIKISISPSNINKILFGMLLIFVCVIVIFILMQPDMYTNLITDIL